MSSTTRMEVSCMCLSCFFRRVVWPWCSGEGHCVLVCHVLERTHLHGVTSNMKDQGLIVASRACLVVCFRYRVCVVSFPPPPCPTARGTLSGLQVKKNHSRHLQKFFVQQPSHPPSQSASSPRHFHFLSSMRMSRIWRLPVLQLVRLQGS